MSGEAEGTKPKKRRYLVGKTTHCRTCEVVGEIASFDHRGGFNNYHCKDRIECARRVQASFGWTRDELYTKRAPGIFDGGAELRQKLSEWAALTCSCGNFYTWSEYLKLEPAAGGSQQPSEDERGAPVILELRNCKHCQSTMARPRPLGAKP